MSKIQTTISASFLFLVAIVLFFILFVQQYRINIQIPSLPSIYLQDVQDSGRDGPGSTITQNSLADELASSLNYVVVPDLLEMEEQLISEINKNIVYSTQPEPGSTEDCKLRRPFPREIVFSNIYWQVMQIKGKGNYSSTIFLYNAYLDTRSKEPIVHILVESDRYFRAEDRDLPQSCHFWYPDRNKAATEKVISIESIFRWWSVGVKSQYHPFLISCPVPANISGNKTELELPEAVSLAIDRCDIPSHEIKIEHNVPETRQDFGVCFKWIDFPTIDISRKIVEMVEFLKILGVGGVHFYKLWASKETDQVLKYYASTGYATVKPYTLPGFQPQLPLSGHLYFMHNNESKVRQELTPYVDCFLSNMYRYKYIGILDLDEVILPVKQNNYQALFAELEEKYNSSNKQKPSQTSFCFDMKLFVDRMLYKNNTVLAEIDPSEMHSDPNTPFFMTKLHFDKDVICASKQIRNIKCYHNTQNVLIVSNHRPTYCIEGKKDAVCHSQVNLNVAYTHHSKVQERHCQLPSNHSIEFTKNPFGFDDNILRFKDQVIEKRDSVLNIIQGKT